MRKKGGVRKKIASSEEPKNLSRRSNVKEEVRFRRKGEASREKNFIGDREKKGLLAERGGEQGKKRPERVQGKGIE